MEHHLIIYILWKEVFRLISVLDIIFSIRKMATINMFANMNSTSESQSRGRMGTRNNPQ